MRACPLAGGITIPCSSDKPMCPYCRLKGRHVALSPIAHLVTIAPAPRPQKVCAVCGAEYQPTSPRQQRCPPCAVLHTRKKNLEYQHAFRQRHKTDANPRMLPDAERTQFEMLHADGMTASAIAQKLGHSHHTVLKHLARPEARHRVEILRKTDMPQLPEREW